MQVPAKLHVLLVTLTLAPWTASALADPAPEDPEAGSPPPQADQLFAEGRDDLFRGEYQKAAELLEKAVAADDTKTGYRLHLARAYRYAGDDQKADRQEARNDFFHGFLG